MPASARLRLIAGQTWAWIALGLGTAFFARGLLGRKPWETSWAARVAEGKTPRFEDYVDSGLWWASLAGVAVYGILLATARWWKRPSALAAPGTVPARRRLGLVVLAVILPAALWVRWPRMDHSLWGDEEWAMRPHVIGKFDRTKAGQVTFKPATWRETLFGNRLANNHILQSTLSAGCHRAWRDVGNREAWEFSEKTLRAPSLAAGLLGIAAAYALPAAWGMPVAGITAAAFLAIHPWHIRYSTEARGYAIAMLTVTALLLCASKAWRDTRWRWAWGGAASGWAGALAWPGLLPALALTHAVILGALAFRRGARPGAIRWLVANAAIAPWAALILFPNLPQIQHQVETSAMFNGRTDAAWARDAGALLAAGVPWRNGNTPLPSTTTFPAEFSGDPWLCGGALAVCGALLATGAATAWRRGGAGPALACGAVLAGMAAMVAITVARGRYVFPWYLVPALPVVVVLFCTGLVSFALAATRRFACGKAIAGAALAACIAWYAVETAPITGRLRVYPVEDLRAFAKLSRGAARWPFDPGNRTTVLLWRKARLYDPEALTNLKEPGAFLETTLDCIAAGRELVVAAGMLGSIRTDDPTTVEALYDTRVFERGPILLGTEAKYALHVFRLRADARPGPLRKLLAKAKHLPEPPVHQY